MRFWSMALDGGMGLLLAVLDSAPRGESCPDLPVGPLSPCRTAYGTCLPLCRTVYGVRLPYLARC